MTSREVLWRKVLVRSGLVIAAAVAVVAAVYVVFWPLSDLIARHDVGVITGPNRAAALQAARDAARGRLVAFGAGLFAVGALIYTARNFGLSRQGQVTDRYTKAIEQLGSDKLDVRIGGVYALERIARDSRRDHPTIVEVLAAFIREHSREQWPPAGDIAEPPDRVTRPDVHAAATVIGRRIFRYDGQPINLNTVNLPRVSLDDAHLAAVDLNGADLTGATLTGAHLTGANLTRADLTRADLTRADLDDADLTGASLDGANFTGATLLHANLTGATLSGANFTRASLANPYLSSPEQTGADLTGAYLMGADLTGAYWPSVPTVPDGWQRICLTCDNSGLLDVC